MLLVTVFCCLSLLVAAWLSLGPQKQRWRRWAFLWSPRTWRTWPWHGQIGIQFSHCIPALYSYDSLTKSICLLQSTETWIGLSPNKDGGITSESQWNCSRLFQSRCKDSEGQSGCLHFSYSEVGARILKPEHGGLQMFSGGTSAKPLLELHMNKWKDTSGNTHKRYGNWV